jgi:phosphate starvation-inducible PhoH-like protein
MAESKRLTRKQRRMLLQENISDKANASPLKKGLELKEIYPLTENQKRAFSSYKEGKNLILHGIAGTGKSFISLYLALNEILNEDPENKKYDNITLIRSVVPTRDMGFLPGKPKEKSEVYEAPYTAICSELFGRKDAYTVLKQRNDIEFITTSFIRGVTLNNTIIIVDEIANMTLHELDSVITRVGKNCKIIFCGDFRQSDFTKEYEKSGLLKFMEITKRMKAFDFIDFVEEDIVRSGLVKSYIIEKDKLGILV